MLGGEHAGPWVCQKDCVCARSGLCISCVCTSVCGHDVLPMTEAQFTHPVPCSGLGTGDVSWCGCEGSTCLRHARLADTITPMLSLCHHPPPGSTSQMQKPQSGPKHQSPQTPPDTDISYVTLKTHAAGAGRQKAVLAGRVWIDIDTPTSVHAASLHLARWEQGLNVSVFLKVHPRVLHCLSEFAQIHVH